MGVYIKGMELPTTHEVVVHILPDGTASIHDLAYTQTKETVAVEVPKHGELIDRMVAVQMVDKLVPFYSGDLMKVAACAVLNANDLVPTVIEEE